MAPPFVYPLLPSLPRRRRRRRRNRHVRHKNATRRTWRYKLLFKSTLEPDFSLKFTIQPSNIDTPAKTVVTTADAEEHFAAAAAAVAGHQYLEPTTIIVARNIAATATAAVAAAAAAAASTGITPEVVYSLTGGGATTTRLPAVVTTTVVQNGGFGELTAAVMLFLFAFAVFAVYLLYISLPPEICDRRKIQVFEFGLRLSNEYLGELLELVIGAKRRNRALRLLTGFLFAFQPRNPKWCRVEMTRIAGVSCRVYLPLGTHRKSNACLVYIHGGGFCIMRSKYYDTTLMPLVRRLGVPIISIDYRLSPEATFGVAIEQCEAVVNTLYEARYKEYGIDRSRIAIVGDSAGGNLSAVLAQRAVRQGRAEIFRCQVLIYPVIQMLDMLSPSYRYYYRAYKGTGLLNPKLMARWLLMYLGVDATPANVRAVLKNQHVASEIRTDPNVQKLMDYNKLPEQFCSEGGKRSIEDEKATNPYQYPPDEKLAARLTPFLRNPDFCPLLGEQLAGVAPALVVTAGVDVLRDEGVLYAHRLCDAKVAVKWRHYPRAFHGIIHMPYSRQRDQIFDDIADYLRERLAPAST